MSDAHDPAIAGCCNQGKEVQRLHKDKGQLERLRTGMGGRDGHSSTSAFVIPTFYH